jgi:two-component system, NarL family, nitrate/nitrite response regulator NarL
VLVADDHPVYREGIVRAVKERPDLELVAEVATGREALDAIAELRPHVAVLDMKMPDLDGAHVLGAIGRDELPTRVLFVSAYVDSEIVYAAIGGGARGYLSKDATRQQICDAVAAVARGDTVFAAQVQTGIAHEIQLRSADAGVLLTPREREILELIASGSSNQGIADKLVITVRSVEKHVSRIFDRLDLPSNGSESRRVLAVLLFLRS